jgi:hypothetical protein
MGALKNQFSWSISRGKLFEECARKYYYNYYGSWNGWSDDGPETARLCYRLKQIMDLPMWAGKIVHHTLETTLKRYRRGQGASLERMKSSARDALNSQWKESLDGLWMRHAKKYTNLFEHYYGIDVDAEGRAAIRKRVFDSLENFEAMGCAEQLRALAPEDWRSVEELRFFDVGGVKVWVVLDCAFRQGDNLAIYDWKTGRVPGPDDQGAVDQLTCYALFAAQQWSVPIETVRVSAIYLSEGQTIDSEVSPEQAIDFRERLFESAKAMTDRLVDVQDNRAEEKDFPRTDQADRCRRCCFFEACYADRSLTPPPAGGG